MYYFSTFRPKPPARLTAAIKKAGADLSIDAHTREMMLLQWLDEAPQPPSISPHADNGEVMSAIRKKHRITHDLDDCAIPNRPPAPHDDATQPLRVRRRKERARHAMKRVGVTSLNPIGAIRTLMEAGCYLLRTNPDKTPIARRWNRRREDPDDVILHCALGDKIAVIPATIGYTVLDVDKCTYRGLSRLITLFPPALVTPSQNGWHLWYRDDRGRRRRTWAFMACRGDVISEDAYVILHNGPETILALARSTAGEPYPADVMRYVPRTRHSNSFIPPDHSPERQRARGINSGIARRQIADIKASIAKTLRSDGLKQKQIAAELKITDRTVRNYLESDARPVADAKYALRWLRGLFRYGNPGRLVVARAIAKAESNLFGGDANCSRFNW